MTGIVVAVCCIAGTTASLLTRGQPSGEPAPTPGLGQAVRDGMFEFVVTSVDCGRTAIDNGWLHADAKGQFCVVALSVRNIGREARRFADGLQLALGPSGERYTADTGAGVVANGNGQAVWEVINPGIRIEAKLVYDIPAGATISTLVLHDAALSGGVVVAV